MNPSAASEVRSCLDACLAACKGGDADECAESCGEAVKTLLKCDPQGQPPNVAGQPVGASPDLAECDRLCHELQNECQGTRGAAPRGASLTPGQWALVLEGITFVVGLFQRWRQAQQTP